MNFGGPQGERLSLLNRVTPFLCNRGLLKGMGFFYDDGTELIFGSRRIFNTVESTTICLEPSFEIRGSAGERIIRIGYADANARPRPYFQVKAPKTQNPPSMESKRLMESVARLRPIWLLNPHLECIAGTIRSSKARLLPALPGVSSQDCLFKCR